MLKNWILTAALSLFASQAFAHEGAHHGGGHSGTPLAAHLSFAQAGVHAHLSWEAGPAVGAESVLRVEFKKASDHSPAFVSATPEVVLWMPSMGHGSAPTVIQRVLDENGEVLPGVFRVSNIFFIMGGDWDVRLALKWPNGAREEQSFSLRLDSNGEGGHHHH